jgi:hypothetical protein
MTELFTLPNALAGLIVVALNGYVLLGGADFGGGARPHANLGPLGVGRWGTRAVPITRLSVPDFQAPARGGLLTSLEQD